MEERWTKFERNRSHASLSRDVDCFSFPTLRDVGDGLRKCFRKKKKERKDNQCFPTNFRFYGVHAEFITALDNILLVTHL